MKVVTDYDTAIKLIEQWRGMTLAGKSPYSAAVDIGKQFGTRILFTVDLKTAHQLLAELRSRDLPCPTCFFSDYKVLIGAEPI